jgi:hypothetical protein
VGHELLNEEAVDWFPPAETVIPAQGFGSLKVPEMDLPSRDSAFDPSAYLEKGFFHFKTPLGGGYFVHHHQK